MDENRCSTPTVILGEPPSEGSYVNNCVVVHVKGQQQPQHSMSSAQIHDDMSCSEEMPPVNRPLVGIVPEGLYGKLSSSTALLVTQNAD